MCSNLGQWHVLELRERGEWGLGVFATLPSGLRTSDHPVLGVPVLVQELGQLRRLSGPSLS